MAASATPPERRPAAVVGTARRTVAESGHATTREGSSADSVRYGAVAIALHWLIGVALLAQMAFGFALDDLAPRATPARAMVVNLHKSTGIVLGLLVVARVAWRLGHRPPPLPPGFPATRARLVALGHRALYAGMIGVPLSGYLASNFSRHGVRFFGAVLPPWGVDDARLYAIFNSLHVGLAAALAVLIAGHVGVAIGHAVRDGGALFGRMWPPRARAARNA